MTPYNTAATSSSSGESKQNGAEVPVAAAALPASGGTAEEAEILEAVDRLSHYHSIKHHFHKPGRQLGARFGRVFVAGAGYVYVCVRAGYLSLAGPARPPSRMPRVAEAGGARLPLFRFRFGSHLHTKS